MRITRKEVLKAIRTENLKEGSPISDRDGVLDKECKVCAVGAVLRQKGIDDESIHSTFYQVTFGTYGVDGTGDEHKALRDKEYLGALSIKFEKLAANYGCGKRTRTRLTEFVKDNFPKQFNTRKVS